MNSYRHSIVSKLIIYFLLILILMLSACSPNQSNSIPNAPSELEIDNEEDSTHVSDSEEGDLDISISENSEGRQILTFNIPDLVGDGVYFGIVESEDGLQVAIPLEQSEGEEDQLEGYSPALSVDQEYTIQVFFHEAYAPVFGDEVGFSGIVEESFALLQGIVLPEAYQIPEDLGVIDFAMTLSILCKEWENNDNKPDELHSFCRSFPPSGFNPLDFAGNANCFGADAILSSFCNPFGSATAATMPDPDCEGEDAGSFWCQETEEEPYYAGRMAVLCKDQLGINFKDPLTAYDDEIDAINQFEDPLTAIDPYFSWDDEEDPIIQFEDPLTAFEDPLTAFEDPLTAFEDPLTAFEDPLTALDVARITILYSAMSPFMEDAAQFPACNTLALLGSAGHYSRTGETLFTTISQWYSSAQPVSPEFSFNGPSALDTSAHCSEFFNTQIEYDWFYVDTNIPRVDLGFSFSDGIPGMTYQNPGDPFPFIYRATLGEANSEKCSRLNLSLPTMTCVIEPYDQSNFGQEQELSVSVSGCSEPIYESSIVLPEFDYSRCAIFEDMSFNLYVSQANTNLQLFATRSGGVPGPANWGMEDYPGFDQMHYSYWASFNDVTSYNVRTFVEDNTKLYADFEVPYSYLTSPQEFKLYIDKCDEPIMTKWITVIQTTAEPDVTEVSTAEPDDPTAEPTATPVPCDGGPPEHSCLSYDWETCMCTVCNIAGGYNDWVNIGDGICEELPN